MDNDGISLAALSKKIPPPRVDGAYGKELFRIGRSLGLDEMAMARLAGVKASKPGDASLHRLKTKAPVLLAWRMRQGLVARGAAVPPIVLGDGDLARWASAGAALARVKPDEFLRELERVETRAHALESAHRTLHGDEPVLGTRVRIGAESGQLPRGVDSEDRAATYATHHGPSAESTLDPARKSAPRRRP